MTTPEKTQKPGRKPQKRPGGGDEQYERFREFAREVGADDDPQGFDERFRKIVPSRKSLS